MDVKFNEVFARLLTAEELGQLRKTDLIELVTVYQCRENLFTQTLQGALQLIENLAGMTVALSKRLSKTLDLLFKGSLKLPKSSKTRLKKKKKKPIKGKQLPTLDYPYLPVYEKEVAADEEPICGCGHHMVDSGMRESSERLEVRPKSYFITRYNRIKYTCKSCYIGIATAPTIPQIIPGSCYGDSIVKDVILSKLCDLIPITRYTAIAARHGVEGMPANSLYGFARHMAVFISPSYARLGKEIKEDTVIGIDETRHNMLEGSTRKNWYLWTINCPKGILFQFEPSRASGIVTNFLKGSACEVIVSDAYIGYVKAINDINEARSKNNAGYKLVVPSYCNSHARNNFCASSIKKTRQAKYIIWIYRIIFANYPMYLTADGDAHEQIKLKIVRAYNLMERIAIKEMPFLSNKSDLYDAFEYLLKYSKGLQLFLTNRLIPMHNMRSEQSFRNFVIGRKTWYGTHSEDSARDLGKIMSLVESCKFLKINPRIYFDDAIERVHKGEPALSPYEYKQKTSSNSS